MVRAEVLKAYRDNDYEYYEKPEDVNEASFFEKAKASQNEVQHQITQVFRLKQGDEEKMYYQEILASKDYLGNHIDHSRVMGKYKMPIFAKRIDANTGKPLPVEVQDEETIYDMPFDPKKLRHLRDIKHINEFTNFVLITTGRRYGDFSFDDFVDSSFEELRNIGKYGTKDAQVIKAIRGKEKK